MRASNNCFNLIKEFEGLILNPYLCPANEVTIGYGHLCRSNEAFLKGLTLARVRGEILEEKENKTGNFVKIGSKKIYFYPGIKITPSEADMLLRSDVEFAEEAVDKLIEKSLSQNQFDALVSFTYNLGVSAFSRSTLRKKINKIGSVCDYDGASEEFHRWVYCKGKKILGLVRRRKKEAELFDLYTEPATDPFKKLKNSIDLNGELPHEHINKLREDW